MAVFLHLKLENIQLAQYKAVIHLEWRETHVYTVNFIHVFFEYTQKLHLYNRVGKNQTTNVKRNESHSTRAKEGQAGCCYTLNLLSSSLVCGQDLSQWMVVFVWESNCISLIWVWFVLLSNHSEANTTQGYSKMMDQIKMFSSVWLLFFPDMQHQYFN